MICLKSSLGELRFDIEEYMNKDNKRQRKYRDDSSTGASNDHHDNDDLNKRLSRNALYHFSKDEILSSPNPFDTFKPSKQAVHMKIETNEEIDCSKLFVDEIT
jgi:hypothetical protein